MASGSTGGAWATEENYALLRRFWDDGVPTVEIAFRLHTSKNAIVGRAHRMRLKARPSPIIYGPNGSPRVLSTTPGAIRSRAAHARASAGLPPLPRPAPPPLPALESSPIDAAFQQPRTTPLPAKQTPAPIPHSAGRTEPCCWPLGTPGTTAFRYCDDPTSRGKPYCQSHAALAYVKIRDSAGKAAHAGGGD